LAHQQPDLFITAYVPDRKSGRGIRTCSTITALARRGPVDVAYVPFGNGPPASDLVDDERISLRPIESSRGPTRLLSALVAVANSSPWDIARAVSPQVIAVARNAPQDARIIADGTEAAAGLLPVGRHRDAIYLAHNLESAFRGTPSLRRFERRVLRRFRESWLPTHADMEAARALAGDGLCLRYAPNVVDVTALPVAGERPGRQVALFVGDFVYHPNKEGLAYLVDEVMPLVWEKLPDATVEVVGRGVERPPADPRIRTRGFVEDLEAEYAAADAVVVPVLGGGGSPLKFVEALARGLPVVASGYAASRLEHGAPGEHFLAAEDAAGFASALVEVLSGQHADLGRRARAMAERFYSIEALATQLDDSPSS
jgi:polysaccharide biosynthesis protein PslH